MESIKNIKNSSRQHRFKSLVIEDGNFGTGNRQGKYTNFQCRMFCIEDVIAISEKINLYCEAVNMINDLKRGAKDFITNHFTVSSNRGYRGDKIMFLGN